MSKSGSRITGLAGRVGQIFHQIFHIYRRWWIYILPFAAILLIPVDLIDSLVDAEIEKLPDGKLSDWIVFSTLAGALASTSLLGQVFLAGAIGLSLLHTQDGNPPKLRWLARHISYGRLIAVDLLFLVVVIIGWIFLILPGMLALVFFALVGPVVEIEDRGIRGAFRRSFGLVRKDFWLVFWVLFLTQLGGHYLGSGINYVAISIFGDARIVEAIATGSTSVLIEPLFAIATVLLTMRLSGRKPPPVAAPHQPAS